MQAANTGLTGGSTPDGSDYDRDVVIVSTLRMAKIRLIGDGRQVICLSGATLFQLENALKPLGREPHSVIGSSCIGASVIGGICNNSGGALIHRGPAYTQMTLFARIDETGEVQLVNHLGVRLDGPEQILDRVVHNAFAEADIDYTSNRVALDRHYGQDVRDIDADTPGRFNADPKRLFEASGRAGKVMIFAVRLDTFPKFAVKARADAIASRLGLRDFSDKITQMGSHLFPKHLPRQMREYRDKYEHYLILKSLTRIASATRYPLYSRRDITASPDGVT
jgi:D-lactate dehydrogenase